MNVNIANLRAFTVYTARGVCFMHMQRVSAVYFAPLLHDKCGMCTTGIREAREECTVLATRAPAVHFSTEKVLQPTIILHKNTFSAYNIALDQS